MQSRWWNECINHRDAHEDHATEFIKTYFSREGSRTLFITGLGSDSRSSVICGLLAKWSQHATPYGYLVLEERPDPKPRHAAAIDNSMRQMKDLLKEHTVVHVQVFANDGAVVGGRDVIRHIQRFPLLDCFTDIVVDISVMSIGVAYPLVRFLFQFVHEHAGIDLHLVMVDDPVAEDQLVPIPSDKASPLFGFQGRLTLDASVEAVRLWLPQLTQGRKAILDKINAYIKEPKDVCPILPLSEVEPKLGDNLVSYYLDEFESTWEVDERNVLYIDDRNPLDLYRTILKIDDTRRKVFAGITESMIVLSPVGRKASGVGALMAAIERNYPVVYVEAIDYTDGPEHGRNHVCGSGKVVHVWLYGKAYPPGNFEIA